MSAIVRPCLPTLRLLALLICLLAGMSAIAQQPRLSHWMTDLGPTHLWEKPLNQIAMPGSHDAGTYAINRSPGWSGNDEVGEFKRRLREGGGGLVGTVEYELLQQFGVAELRAVLDEVQAALWTTQSLSIRDQLDVGVRYFDARLSWDAERREWYFYHGSWVKDAGAYYGPLSHSLESELAGIADWARAHPGEVFVLHLRKLNGGSVNQKRALVERLKAAFVDRRGRSLLAEPAWLERNSSCVAVPGENRFSADSPYGDFVRAGRNVIVIDESGRYGLTVGAQLALAQTPFWSSLRCYTDGVENSDGYVNAANFNELLDIATDQVDTAASGSHPQLRVSPVFPPADNLKYWIGVIQERYITRLPAQGLVELSRQLPRTTCPDGARLDFSSGECFRCPAGYTRNLNLLVPETSNEACVPAEQSSAGEPRGNPSGLLGTDCPGARSILNIADQQCYRCPRGYNKNALQPDMRQGNACLRAGAGGTTAATPAGRPKRLGVDRYFNPRKSFLEIGRSLNLALIGRLQGAWRNDPTLVERLNVVMVDNLAMAREPGDRSSDPSIARAIVAFNLVKRAQPQRASVPSEPPRDSGGGSGRIGVGSPNVPVRPPEAGSGSERDSQLRGGDSGRPVVGSPNPPPPRNDELREPGGGSAGVVIGSPNRPGNTASSSDGDLSGVRQVRVRASGRHWHSDGGGDRILSTRYQPNDEYTRFVFERQRDGSYRLQVQATGRYLHVDGLGDRLVSTRYETDDDYTRFYFERERDGSYRIRVKASGRYLHADGLGDQLISTRYQANDDYSRFDLR